ncbi:hypothetical protein SPRG_03709 [Saprolegnia parasitica CBS 223.65]|uniref:ChrR-like cupin domain-containing protein n=1 Tax=Saprolegnia parasitica (strain CBS 223.65) TaxID=695850 RepID=A0A067CM82_SAPPC|nr:hypothetical protein SPRG_03709 [Saprolegnia parasitica CBS 223.65]KDO31789.1 hypothetical protein SPRG_03709 [Saprolegnia parasitica CBS 223.65]|eukprot:XP_012197669.1 hypothetical protein SPRG_03709 [Saprolegnia parasitica CBS 223.65]
MLDRDGDEVARATTLVRYAPNSTFPPHTHAAGEEFLVLQGTFRDDVGVYPAGTYVRNAIGSVHAPSIGPDGCLILVKLRWMAPEDTHAVVDTLHETPEWTTTDGGGRYLRLYASPATSEKAWMLHLPPGVTYQFKGNSGGHEFFIVDGSVEMTADAATSGEYGHYDWIRLPPQTAENVVVVRNPSPTAMARLFVKTDHLARFLDSSTPA